ncbi:MAG: SpoIID/LytB domain-containing protein, partial [Clostridia bacterium]|nr:SpoIID/LytB domain-containing protein [Clostridia bacterium]
LSINMEDYLRGVVAYEMSDSWPLEALKAQAVAARTYAMQRKWSAGTRDYDLVDTTADQVFKGFNPEYTNVIEAVRATEGVVGTWKDGFATCYYTASNGGETALPEDVWSGTGDAGYLARAKDPYDLENSNSLVVSATFNPGATDLPVLQTMLQEGLEAEAARLDVQEQELRFEEILSIEPVNPVAEGSLMYKTLRFTLSASAMKRIYLPASDDVGAPGTATANPGTNQVLQTIDYLRRLLSGSPFRLGFERQILPDSFTVDLDVYSQIKDKLDLSLNGSDYEVVSVKDGVFDFTIEMRRFGHGVGMSQRGAQTMAGSHGKRWTEILSFYYPGMTLEKIDWDTPVLAAIEELPESIGAARPDPTPTPTPAPLPALQDGEYYAKVSLGDASSSLNMRKNPTTQSPVVTMLGNGRRVIVCSEADADGWVAIKTAEFSGYAKLEYLTKE